MDLLTSFRVHWKKEFSQLSTANCRLLLAVSGGVDSVVLCDLVARSGFDFIIAHCNFRLRGAESERDEEFVRSLGLKYGKEVLVKQFDTQRYATDKKIAIQEAARELRYDWFASIVNGGNGEWSMVNGVRGFIVTGHHADDTIETVLMHLFRGTGIKGLTGIQAMQVERLLIRPLLPFRKQQLLDHAVANGLVFAEDASNSSDKYTRNFFRNRLIPAVKEIFPAAEDNMLHTIDHLSEAAVLYEQAVQQHLSKLVERKGEEVHIPVLKWKKVLPLRTITWELIRPYGFSAAQTDEAIKLLDADNGSYLQSPTHRLIRNRNWMIIAPNANENAAHILVEKEDGRVVFENGSLHIRHGQAAATSHQFPVTKNTEALLDASGIRFPLLLRKWKTGDYFYPLGMQKKKKLSRFLIDLKLSKTDKEKVWVLESDKKILWVIGYRIDDRFKITDGTKKTLQLSYLK